MLSRALLSLVALQLSDGAAFNFNQCDLTNGPLAPSWGGAPLCGTQASNGNGGTPVDLCGAVAYPGGPPNITYMGYTAEQTSNVYNTGSTIQIGRNSGNLMPAWLWDGSISSTIGRSPSSAGLQNWTLWQIHPHWGRSSVTTGEGSEHALQGNKHDMEWHLVHYNMKYASGGDAVESGDRDALLVVGVFARSGTPSNPLISNVASKLGTLSNEGVSITFRPSDLVTNAVSASPFYTYAGSLTTPRCVEVVTWIVYTEPVLVSDADLARFKSEYTTPGDASSEQYGVHGNWRPLVPIAGRTIWHSSGATPACSPVNDRYSCGGLSTGPSVLVLLCAFGFVSRHFL